MKKKILIGILLAFGIVIIFGAIMFLLVYNGIVLLNNPSSEEFPVRGVDVSVYQGEIDWQKLSEEDIQFAFIKATEGSGYVDDKFSQNYENAQKTDLRIGAYHFFSYDSSGETQAENFINTVAKTDDMLPPVIDIEFYGDKKENLPDKDKTQKELDVLISKLEEYYGKTPIIYATEKSYELYIADKYDNCDIWIRNVYTKPKLSDERKWTFWQYTNKEQLSGYSGDEKYIDMNVFNGNESDFESYGK